MAALIHSAPTLALDAPHAFTTSGPLAYSTDTTTPALLSTSDFSVRGNGPQDEQHVARYDPLTNNGIVASPTAATNTLHRLASIHAQAHEMSIMNTVDTKLQGMLPPRAAGLSATPLADPISSSSTELMPPAPTDERGSAGTTTSPLTSTMYNPNLLLVPHNERDTEPMIPAPSGGAISSAASARESAANNPGAAAIVIAIAMVTSSDAGTVQTPKSSRAQITKSYTLDIESIINTIEATSSTHAAVDPPLPPSPEPPSGASDTILPWSSKTSGANARAPVAAYATSAFSTASFDIIPNGLTVTANSLDAG